MDRLFRQWIPALACVVLLAATAPLSAGQAFLLPSNPRPGAQFGKWVAAQGKYLLIGEFTNQEKNGTASLFDMTTGKLLSVFTVPPGGRGSEAFACAGAVTDTHSIIGAHTGGTGGKVYLFEHGKKDPPKVLEGPIKESNFGSAIAAEGNEVLISSPETKNFGMAYLYNLETLQLKHKFEYIPPKTERNWGDFGRGVALSPEYVVVGAPLFQDARGGAYLYSRESGELLHQLETNYAPFGRAGEKVAIGGDRIIVGAATSDSGGRCHVFDAKSGKEVGVIKNEQGFGNGMTTCGDVAVLGATGYVAMVDLTNLKELGRLVGYDATIKKQPGVRVKNNKGEDAELYGFGSALAATPKFLVTGADQVEGGGLTAVFSDWGPAKLLNARARPAAKPAPPKKEVKPPVVATKQEPSKEATKEPELRLWSDATGNFKIEASYHSYLGKEVIRLRKKDGSLVDIPIDKLSSADQTYARSISAAERAKRGE